MGVSVCLSMGACDSVCVCVVERCESKVNRQKPTEQKRDAGRMEVERREQTENCDCQILKDQGDWTGTPGYPS